MKNLKEINVIFYFDFFSVLGLMQSEISSSLEESNKQVTSGH